MTGWSFLPVRFRKAVERLGFQSPTPVQSACIPKALQGESFRAVAPTGTGKTLVYLFPIWKLREIPRAQALVLLPTRELAYQVSQMLQALDPDLRDGTAMAIGGHAKENQVKHIREGWRTLIATPGRLLELLEERSVSLKDLELLVLDEFDKLVGMGFEEQIAAILKKAPKKMQRLLLSATAFESAEESGGKTDEKNPEGLQSKSDSMPVAANDAFGLSDLPLVTVERESGSRKMEEAFFFLKSIKKKGALLIEELTGVRGQAIVFVANRDKANHLQGLLRLRGVEARVLHGHLLQAQRAEAYEEFRKGKFRVLVATDLASRGLDMPEVDLIVNYDLPRHYKDYVHRTGRTARRGRAGRCVSYAGPEEYLPMRNLEKEFPGPLPVDPAFSQRDRWFHDAKRNHDHKVQLEARQKFIRREQGLEE